MDTFRMWTPGAKLLEPIGASRGEDQRGAPLRQLEGQTLADSGRGPGNPDRLSIVVGHEGFYGTNAERRQRSSPVRWLAVIEPSA